MPKTRRDPLAVAVAAHTRGARSGGAALLAWFLEEVWRLDPAVVEDSICDSAGDKGIDGIVVDKDALEITVFQSKYRTNAGRTQGDKDLRDLRGVHVWFDSPEGIDHLLAARPNEELRKLVDRLDLRSKLEAASYSLRLVFVTNSSADAAATDYLRVAPIDLWDGTRLGPIARRTSAPDLLAKTQTLPMDGGPAVLTLQDKVRIAVGLVPAKTLVALPGIEDLSLFRFNVRLGLGRTRINKEIRDTISIVEEHSLFPAYHNGLTLLTRVMTRRGSKLHLTGLSVVNGCQSLLALHEARDRLTDSLRLLVKVVEIGEDPSLSETITFRSNNQNPVSMRDQRATDSIQRDLQAQVRATYGRTLQYVIRRGERVTASESLANDRAAQIIMAVWRKDPSSAVRRTKLFDEDYHRIFARDIDAHKLHLAYCLDEVVREQQTHLEPSLRASFASIRFTLCHLIAQCLRESSQGSQLLLDPEPFLVNRKQLMAELQRLAEDVVESVNYFLQEKAEEHQDDDDAPPYDPKVAFKSKEGVREVTRDVLRDFKKSIRKDPEAAFGLVPKATSKAARRKAPSRKRK